MKLKRYFPVLIIALVLMIVQACHADSGENLLQNADFSKTGNDGLPEYWYTEAYEQEDGFTGYHLVSDAEGFAHAVMIQNLSANDARFAQTVTVDPDSYYVLSGYIRTENVAGGHGANLSFGDVYVFDNPQYKPLYDTDG